MATTSVGGGLSTLRCLCVEMNFPPPVNEHPYNNYLKHIEKISLKNAEESMLAAGIRLRKEILGPDVDDDGDTILDVPISVDGSWQKRYGFNSLLGMVFLISIDTGAVLDFVVKCLFCHECKKNQNASESWKKSHAEICMVNHEGSSGAMEKEGAIEMFLRSIEKHNLRYTKYVGDGDSSAFGSVKEALKEKYGDSYIIEKEDCIGHVQKRMGSALITYKNKKRGSKLSDGKGTGGTGQLTNVAVDKIQTYYGYAIRNNKGKTEKIIEAIWAIFYHMLGGPPSESLTEQHRFCPKTPDTWCKFQKDIIESTNNYSNQTCLPFIFRDELEPIFNCLSSRELLSGCEQGLTQNANENLNGMVWSKCQKRVFCGRRRYTISLCESVTHFNEGGKG